MMKTIFLGKTLRFVIVILLVNFKDSIDVSKHLVNISKARLKMKSRVPLLDFYKASW